MGHSDYDDFLPEKLKQILGVEAVHWRCSLQKVLFNVSQN